MESLEQVFSRLRKVSRACLPAAERVSPEILRLVTKLRMSFSEPFVCSGISGRSSTKSSSSLLARIRATASSSSAKPVTRPKIRAKRCLSAARRAGFGSSLLQVGVEPPRQLALEVDQALLLRGGADHAPEVALGMDPAQRVGEDVELAGIIRDDDRVAQQPARGEGTDPGRLAHQPPRLSAARCPLQAASSEKPWRSWASRAVM